MKYPIGIQNFGEIRRGGYAYVDKTALMYKMVDEGKYYFLSRPRRFGKSLMVSTLEAFFSGKKELFEGLYAGSADWDWQEYPILHLDLNAEKFDTAEALTHVLDDFLARHEQRYGKSETERSPGLRFQGVIRRACEQTGRQVVILIDEYDKPLLQAIGNEVLQTEYRNTLKAFYGVLKSCDAHIKFAFLTGVTKFGKVSVFSDLNNLIDISIDHRYAEVCGISEHELYRDFNDSILALAEANGLTKAECCKRLRLDYDGYHFGIEGPGMYNPFSVLNTFAKLRFSDYWFETGTPSFLVHQLKKTCYPLENMTVEEVATDTLNSIDVMDDNPLPLLYQSGYLTIRSYDSEFDTYTLGFPNREVEQGFIKYLLPFYTPKVTDKTRFSIKQFTLDVQGGRAEAFMQRLEDFFATGDYEVVGKAEKYFQNTLYVFFRLLGFYVDVVRHTANGRMDTVIQTPEYIYILELKIDRTAAEALQQIEDKGYARPFEGDRRTLFKIGVNFSTATKLIDWVTG